MMSPDVDTPIICLKNLFALDALVRAKYQKRPCNTGTSTTRPFGKVSTTVLIGG